VGARRILTSVVRREPENVEAWIWLARASSDSPATFRRAVTRVQQLIPSLPARR
jgi:cytochrome c-type biogenesis protein CcmH/NrfG